MLIFFNNIYILFYFFNFFILIISIYGCFLKQRNLLSILIIIEHMLIAVQLNYILGAHQFNNINGLIYTLFILMVAAAEVAIGLALVILNYKLRGTIETKFLYLVKA